MKKSTWMIWGGLTLAALAFASQLWGEPWLVGSGAATRAGLPNGAETALIVGVVLVAVGAQRRLCAPPPVVTATSGPRAKDRAAAARAEYARVCRRTRQLALTAVDYRGPGVPEPDLTTPGPGPNDASRAA
jgi:hypothetical protein